MNTNAISVWVCCGVVRMTVLIFCFKCLILLGKFYVVVIQPTRMRTRPKLKIIDEIMNVDNAFLLEMGLTCSFCLQAQGKPKLR